MADSTGAAYQPTTESIPAKAGGFCSPELGRIHLLLKVAQLVLSFLAFICEEFVAQCESCGGLYFFEFVSCSACLLAFLMLIVYCTPLKNNINITAFKKIDFYVTVVVGLLFFLASAVFASTMDRTDLEAVSVSFGFFASIVFLLEAWLMYKHGYITQKPEASTPGANGVVESQPLNTPIQVSA